MIYERWSWGKSERGRIFPDVEAEGSLLVIENLELSVADALGPLEIGGGVIYERVRRIGCYRQVMIRVLAIIAILILAGCDAHYGVTRTAQIDRFIDHQCVYWSLQSIEQISVVKYDFMGGNPEMTPEMQDAYARHRYHYTVDNVNSFVSVLTNSSGTEINLFSRKNRRPPSQEHINLIRPVMDVVQTAISEHCKIEKLSTLVKETCTKVTCD